MSDSLSAQGKLTGQRQTVRLYLLVSFVLSLVVLIVRLPEAYGIGSILGFSGSMLLDLWPFFVGFFLSAVGLFVTAREEPSPVLDAARVLFGGVAWLRGVNWVFFAVPILFYGYFRLSGQVLPGLAALPDLWLIGHLNLLGAVFLSGTRKFSAQASLLVTVSVYGFLLWVIYFIPDVSDYPLALGWSETSRYYYASLFFAPFIYGKWVPLSSLHPTRYLMQSLPFIIPTLPLWFHRLWQVLLWLGFTVGAGLSLAKRISPQKTWVKWGLAAWFFMFCFQGPVYYHLMVTVIIVLLGFKKDQLWRSLIFVALASIWAGISRVNWFPVPGMLAVALYVLETPYEGRNFWQYWRWPVLAVVLGLPLAFGAQAGYAAISGNPPEVFASSFNSPLFWYRLFPNAAYGPGIINLLVTAALPVWVVIFWQLVRKRRKWHILRHLALLSILLALLGAGLVVSTKIGGGDNLHNLDAFLVMLAVIGAYLAFDRFELDSSPTRTRLPLPVVLVVLAFLVPLVFAEGHLRPYPDLDHARAWEDIAALQQQIDVALADGGEVLFIQQRHLLTFDIIQGVSLVPSYEKVFLMEMAMSGNEAYLSKFYEDLSRHRFDLIVSEPIALITRPASDVFGEENNVWVERVAEPLMAEYAVVLKLLESEMYLLAPRPGE
jgi:hypothetical protein